jgi:hypothetical protein
MTTMHVSHNFRAPTEIRELGEAYPVIKVADDAVREFRKCLELLRTSDNDGLRKCAQELDEVISDALHDASWAYWRDRAMDAHGEAMVRPVKVTRP